MSDEDEDQEGEELEELTVDSDDDVSRRPNENADPPEIVNAKIPQALREKYEIHRYRSAAIILAESHKAEFDEIVQGLLDFSITTHMIRTADGNPSPSPR